MKVVHSDECVLHDPPHEILSGKLVEYLEAPERYALIKDALSPCDQDQSLLFEFVEADLSCSREIQSSILAVHEKDYVEYVRNAYDEWVEDGGDKAAVLPECFAHTTLARGMKFDITKLPPLAKAGLYCFDLSCPITGDTFKSAIAAVGVVLTASRILLSELQESTIPPGIFALTRPPGHHAGASTCGGYCFFNNAAIATRLLQSQRPSRAAILDVDYHHGNGTQEIFYEDPTVFYASLHAAQDYPYFTGLANEQGAGQGQGFNLNIPLPKGLTGDDEYCTALQEAIERISRFEPKFLVLSLGVDTFTDDPICDFKLTTAGYQRIGALVASLRTPTLFVMEGGYDLSTIGRNVRAVLESFVNGLEIGD